MHTTLVHVWVKPEHIKAFRTATLENRGGSIHEPGNLRFDLLEESGTPGKFILLEVFRDEAAARAHKATEHYLRWRETVAPWMAQPRQGQRYEIVAPLAPAAWKDPSSEPPDARN